MAMTCTECDALMRVTRLRMRYVENVGTAQMTRLRFVPVWRCSICGVTAPFAESEILGWCEVCGSKVAEEEYTENFPDMPVRLLVSFVARDEDLARGTYVFACSSCTRCSQCRKPLSARDYAYRLETPKREDGMTKVCGHYFHRECLAAWSAKYAAEMLEARPLDPVELLKDVLRIEV